MWSTLVEKLRSVTLIAVPLISRVCEIFSFRCPVFHESARFVFSLELTHRDHVNARCTESPEIEISFYLKKAKKKASETRTIPCVTYPFDVVFVSLEVLQVYDPSISPAQTVSQHILSLGYFVCLTELFWGITQCCSTSVLNMWWTAPFLLNAY